MNESMENALNWGLQEQQQREMFDAMDIPATPQDHAISDAHYFASCWFRDAADNAWACRNH